MTKRRMPQRGPHGHFVSSNTVAQRDDIEAKVEALLGPSPSRLQTCEECGSDRRTVRRISHGHVLYINYCPRCTPDPLEALS